MEAAPGTLYVVATPIGNLGDISERALETLRKVDLILAEDTRVFGRLAERFGITTPKKSFYEENERGRIPEVVAALESGRSIALVSDSGTPLVSDPGYRLVSECRQRGVAVHTVPGPSAAIAALSISGLPSDRFFFEGFLPQKKGKKRNRLVELLTLPVSVICYESPHRILETLEALAEVAPDRVLFIGRELTKLHEEGIFGTASALLERLGSRDAVKGEIVLIVSAEKK